MRRRRTVDTWQDRYMPLAEALVRIQSTVLVGPLATLALRVLGVSVPPSVQIGDEISLPHGAVGLVVHERTVIGARVKLYQGVTIGRSDTYLPPSLTRSGGRVVIGDDVVVGAGAAILFRSGATLTVGQAAVVGANAVVLSDIPPGEIWAGAPARRLGHRRDQPVS